MPYTLPSNALKQRTQPKRYVFAETPFAVYLELGIRRCPVLRCSPRGLREVFHMGGLSLCFIGAVAVWMGVRDCCGSRSASTAGQKRCVLLRTRAFQIRAFYDEGVLSEDILK